MELITAYLAGVVATMIFAAVRTPDNEMRATTFICVAWPVMVPFILAVMLFGLFGLEFDIEKHTTMFGIRKSPMQNIKGFGISLFYIEFRFYKIIKA